MRRLWAVLLVVGFVFSAAPARAEAESRRMMFVDWTQVTDIKALLKERPFVADVLDDIRMATKEFAGGDPFSSFTQLLTATVSFPEANKTFFMLQIVDDVHCGATIGCGTVFYVDEGQGFSLAYEAQVPDDLYAGVCGREASLIMKTYDMEDNAEGFNILALKDKQFSFQKRVKTLDDAQSCGI